ncbi:unnamed protein product [Parnassius mnemosyne]|uniref:Envelope protein n=1 Tax=Parnassius mnemosyne TaxID=213953 RepID=A0AAV1LAB5_9NEOP
MLVLVAMMTRLQALQLQELNSNPGILPVKQGTAVISNDKWIIAKIIYLKLFIEDVKVNVLRISELNKIVNNLNKNFSYNFVDVNSQVEYIKNLTINKLEQIIPSFRTRRGILNPLVSLIKIVTGNHDNDDAVRYDKLITEVKVKQNSNDNRMTLITEIIQSLTNSTLKLNENPIKINRDIITLSHNLSSIDEREHSNHNETRIIKSDEYSYLCPEDDTSQLIKDDCITELMTYVENISSCIQVPVILEAIRVQVIQPNRWIIYTKESTLLSDICNNEITRRKIHGTFILTLDDNCAAKINDINLTSNPVEIESISPTMLPMINQPAINSSLEMSSPVQLNLEGIDLTDLKFLSVALRKSEIKNSESEKAIVVIKRVSPWTILLYGLLFIIVT